ncbi:zf-HC2 domain-containing protein [Pseudonocardia sp. KRD291]|uniref:zf-HC2 domain-containing protein n=1 Tax=Pseudonocardia sp. KRD291 TaxID=2792007 RepID=UPI001C4A49A9|nr:zf-HC2 domain-containing protein [Pseudonocardia sp. KRD291]MBW0101355.1 zf-HC2 domain-containing protein [Pseudonocardia sp. KRD291]
MKDVPGPSGPGSDIPGSDISDAGAPVSCSHCRERVSARLDGEDDASSPAVDAHLQRCPDCRAFADRAAAVTRLARTGAAESGPDLVASVLEAAAGLRPLARRRRAGVAVRAGLGLVGAGQVALATAGVLGAAIAGTGEMHMGGASAEHFAHESAAWNLALGIGFAAVALGRSRLVAGLLPVLGAFVGVLAVLSVVDLVAGRVDPARLLSHGLLVLGLVLLLLHRRVLRDGGGRAVAPPRAGPVRPEEPLPWPGTVAGPGAVAHASHVAPADRPGAGREAA